MTLDPRHIVEAIRSAGRPLKTKEIARALELPAEQTAVLRDLLQQLDEAAVVHRLPGQRYTAPAKLDLVSGRLQATRGGAGFLIPDDPVQDIYIAPESLNGALDGDRVLVRLERYSRRTGPEGRVVEVLERVRTSITGTFRQARPGRGVRAAHGWVEPEDRRLPQVGLVRSGGGGAADGEMVVVRITDWGDADRGPRGTVEEVLGHPDDPRVALLAIIRQHDLPTSFPAAVEAEAAAIAARGVTAADLAAREDFRDTLVFTIDPADARDHDDAVSLEALADGWRVGVHIADVAHYVTEGGALDAEARRRGTSVYLVDRVLPMLPHALSSGLCSLVPDEDRLTLSLLLDIDREGGVKASRLVRGVIRSRHRLSYEQAQAALEGEPLLDAATVQALHGLRQVSRLLQARRRARGSVDLEMPETRVLFDEAGEPAGVEVVDRLDTHRLIEDLMLLANETLAAMAVERDIPFVYRVHEQPDFTRMTQLAALLASFGIRLGGEGSVTPRDVQQALAQAAGRPEEGLIAGLVLRSLKQARYAAERLGHFGLAARSYTHFTSPIRRYPDLLVHRIAAGVFIDGRRAWLEEETLADAARLASERERIAATAERESRDLIKAVYMLRHVGDDFTGTIASVTSFGFFVLLDGVMIEGLVHISSLEDDYYVLQEEQFALVGERSRRRYRAGDRVEVTVASVDTSERRIALRLVPGAVKRPREQRRP